MDFNAKLVQFRQSAEAALNACLPTASERPPDLHEAMRYSVENGGKRLRPILLLAAAELYPAVADPAPAAAAIEFLHTYSLVHDDLPAMDNSPLRRGRPTVHVRYTEATAILVGDALLTEAFAVLGRGYRETPQLGCRLVEELGRAAGSRHLIGGQFEDTRGEDKALTAEDLDFIHLNKTAALIETALIMGLITTEAPPQAYEQLRRYGRLVGWAFQIVDDLLDATSQATVLGKPVGADAARKKNTYPALHGLEKSRARVRELSQEAQQAVARLGVESSFLEALARNLELRKA